MKLTTEFQPIRDWAEQRGIYAKGDIKTQFLKFSEEVGELGKAIMNKDMNETIDAIGDCVVVLTNLAELANEYYNEDIIDIEECINNAFNVIKNREGKMVNGTFVKNGKS